MAQTRTSGPISGFSRFTQPSAVGTHTTTPGGFIMQDNQGYDNYLWFDTSGKLRCTDATTAEAAGFDWNTGGTIVGSQS